MLKGFKKLVSAFCAASMVLSLAVVPAMAETTTNVTAFTGKSRITVTNGTDSEHTITLTNAGNANNGIAYAYADISSVVSGQTSYKIEYDSCLKSSSRARIELADLTIRPSTSSKSGYENSGVVFCQGVVDSSSYAVNASKSSYAVDPAARDKWVHTSLEVDVTNKKFSVSIIGESVNTTYNNVAFMNDVVPTGITYLDYINSQVAYIKNIKITTKVSPTVTVTKDSTKLNLDPGATSDIAELTNAKTVEVTDTNGNDVLTNGLNGFTFEVDSNKSKVSVTAPQTVGANNTAAVKIKATSEDNLTAEGTATIKVLSDQDVVDDAYNALTLDSVQGLTKKSENTYDVTDEFELPQSSTQARIDWSFPSGTTCAAVENGKVVIKDFSNGTALTLTATIGYYKEDGETLRDGVTAKTKTFTLNFPTDNTLSDDLKDAKLISGDSVKVVKEGEEYTVNGNFSVVQSNDNGTKFVWGSSQYGEITIDAKGNATVDTSEETTVTLKVSARKYSVQDDTYSKTVTIHIEYAPKNIFGWIYTDGMKYNWSETSSVTPTYTDYQSKGMLVASSDGNNSKTVTAAFDSAVTKNAVITYKLAAAERGENASVTVNTGGIVSVLFPQQNGTLVKVGDTEYGFGALSDITYMDKKCVTPFLIIKHYINFDSKTVYTTIQREGANDGDYVCKNVRTAFADSSVTSLKELSIVLGKYNAVYLKSIKVDEVNMPAVVIDSDIANERVMDADDVIPVATVSNSTEVTAKVDDETNYEVSVTGTDSKTVKLKNKGTAAAKSAPTVTISAKGKDFDIDEPITLNIVQKDALSQELASRLDIADDIAVRATGTPDTYNVTSDSALPTSLSDKIASGAKITWSEVSDDSDVINISDKGKMTVSPKGTVATAVIRATVEGYYNGTSAGTYTRDFTLNIADHKYKQYYDENFDSWEKKTVVNMANGSDSINRIDFSCGTRSGDSDNANIKIDAGKSGNGIVLTDGNSYSVGATLFTLASCSGSKPVNSFYASFDFKLDSGTSMEITDTANNTVTYSAGDQFVKDTWYKAEIISDGTNAVLTTYAEDGTIVAKSKTTFGLLKKFSCPSSNKHVYTIDNLKVMDCIVSEIAPEETLQFDAYTEEKLVAKCSNTDKGVVVTPTSDNENVTVSVKDGDVYVKSLTQDVVSAKITVTAVADVTTKAVFDVTSATNANYAKLAKDDLTIPLTQLSSGAYKVDGDFKVSTKLYGASIKWSVDPQYSEYITVSGGTIKAYPKSDLGVNIPLKATITYGTGDSAQTETKEFELDLNVWKSTIQRKVDNYADTAEAKAIQYSKDKGKYFNDISLADNITLISDIYIPSSVTYDDYKLTVGYDFTGGAIDADGKINVTNLEKADATIKKTIAYVKDGKTVYEKTIANPTGGDTFAVKVQFNPADVKAQVEAKVYAVNETTEANATDTVKEEVNRAIKAFVSEPAVALDSAIASNFYATIGTEAAAAIPDQLSTNFKVKTAGQFGTKIAWISDNIVKVSIDASGNGTVLQGTNSASVKLTAVVSYGEGETEATNASAFEKQVTVPAMSTNINPGTQPSDGTNSGTTPAGGGGGGGSSRETGGDSRSSGGGGGSIASGTIANVPASSTSTYEPNANPSGFTDLDSVDWAKAAINNLYVNKVVSGKTDTLFYPNDNVTRAEFAKILVNAFNLPKATVNGATFYDVKTNHWASEYVEAAFASGVIKGFDDGSFEPNTNVTRQDMAVMVLRAAEAAGRTFTEKKEAQVFGDEATIAAYAKTAISTLQKAGVVNGVENGNFAPLATSTRAQACQIIYNIIK